MKKIFKKSVAVLITAVIMLFCWVWITPTEASAANYNVTVTLDIGDYSDSWKLNGLMFEGMNYREADIIVSCIDSEGKATKKTINSVTASDETTISFSLSYFPNEIRFDYAYLSELMSQYNWGGLKDIDVDMSINGINTSFTLGSNNLNRNGTKTYYDVNIGGLITFDMEVNYVYYSMKILPRGYNFDEDSYKFENYSSSLSKKYFTTIYEESSANLLYRNGGKNVGKNGLCFGMAYTTSAFFNYFPKPEIIDIGNATVHNYLRRADKNSHIKIGNHSITVDDYIKYAFVYQFSNENTLNSSDSLFSTLANYVNNGNVGVVIIFNKWKVDSNGKYILNNKGEKISDGKHAVLAVGVIETGNECIILVDDSNTYKRNGFQRITGYKDGSWRYNYGFNGEVSSKNTTIEIALDTAAPYRILKTGNRCTVREGVVNTVNSMPVTETYIEGMNKLSQEQGLLSINSSDYEILNDEYKEINCINEENDYIEKFGSNKMYWLNDKTVSVATNSDQNNLIEFAGDNTILSADITKDSRVSMTINNEIGTEIKTKKGEEFTVSTETIINDTSVKTEISGTASSDTITATQTETGILVTGISDGTVTLTKDEEVIATEEIKDAVGDIEITYDKDGESEDMDAEYHTHSYESAETKAATCKEKGELTYTCSCNDTYTEKIPVNPNNHIGETEVKNAVNSTCTAKGYTGDTYCLDCGEKIADGKETNIKGHTDNDGNNSCDVCGETLKDCSHMCHKTGFIGFIWKILRIIFKLFGCQPVCSCGVAHY